MAGLDKYTAGQLSEAAYIPKGNFDAPGGVPAGKVPDGWRADTALLSSGLKLKKAMLVEDFRK
jgi:hypothetical protein